MPQSLAKVYVHIVFTTKNGYPFIHEDIRAETHSYIIGVISKLGSFTEEIYCNPDHIHILCTLPRTITIADLISKIKTASSKWIKTKGVNNFSWQDGYGVFSVSSSVVSKVENYIRNQPKHHQKFTYKDELIKFFKEYKIEYNEKYLWD
jgi:REP element-mobilizing transposase RayT